MIVPFNHKANANKSLNCINMEILINSQSSLPSQLSLVDLNDYCLLDLMSLFNLEDLIAISTVCKRFEYNAHRLFPHSLKLWKDIAYNVTTSEFLLSKVGIYLTEVEVHNDPNISMEETMGLLQNHCQHLEKIQLHQAIPSSLLTLPLNIKSVAIQFPENWTLSMGFLEGLKRFTKLESLTLKFHQHTEIDSGFLTELPPLKQLTLKNCLVQPLDLHKCLDASKTGLESLSLSKCFSELPNILIESVDQLAKLNELKFHFNCGPAEFSPLNIFNRLTSIKLMNAATSLDVDQLFGTLIDHNKIQTLSLNSIDNNKPLSRTTCQQLHRLTNLRRLCLRETDFVTDEFLTEISKSKNLTHFTYKQTYRPMLSFDATLAFIASNGPILEKCNYIVYHDIIRTDTNSEEKTELLTAYQKTAPFKRMLQCKADISDKLTSVEFLFKKCPIKSIN